ncbi:MAG: sodium:solute symporter family protein [Thermoanaerobaculia bacterium]|nr:sodium:solute symporter family protein [Thermoanaerobaculia bacterium]
MILSALDVTILVAYFLVTLAIGLVVSRRAGRSASDYFASGRSMPWWLLGTSMVATTFSTDTPNLVTDITRAHGVAGNWAWWSFLLTGLLTVFVYARLWRRSGLLTDLEFYELRYSGRAAAFLRGFRALYVGLFFNVAIMAAVSLAAIKIGGVMFGLTPFQTIFVASLVTVVVAALGGLEGVLWTDFFQFGLAMAGSVAAAVVAVRHPEVGGLDRLLAHPEVARRLSLWPDFSQPEAYVPLFLVPLAVQWWASWYPGSEPGGGGYVAQRMLAAKDENHATAAVLLFNVAHYVLRPWPWILVALASLVVFPDLAALTRAFPALDPGIVREDLGYSAMLTFLPSGLLGLVVGSLAAAYMSTISTHLNWGSSYLVHDFYRRFIKPTATDRELVLVGRWSTVVLMVFAGALALVLSNALQAFQVLLQIGAGTGLLFILRWFWWRVSAWSEIVAMAVSGLVAAFFTFRPSGLAAWQELLVGVGLTTAAWLAATFLAPPTAEGTLVEFVRRTRPGGPGWRRVRAAAVARGELPATEPSWSVPLGILCMVCGSVAIYAALFATGSALYGRWPVAAALCVLALGAGGATWAAWRRLAACER